jgi:hypothetical protein
MLNRKDVGKRGFADRKRLGPDSGQRHPRPPIGRSQLPGPTIREPPRGGKCKIAAGSATEPSGFRGQPRHRRARQGLVAGGTASIPRDDSR